MPELFRYIQHAFVVPSRTDPIDVGRQSDFQDSLRHAASSGQPRDQLRRMADAFIARHFRSPVDDPLNMGRQLQSLSDRLASGVHGPDAIEQLISTTFGSGARELVGSDGFQQDKSLLDDTLVAVKITTGFDRVNAHDLVANRQALAFIEDFAAGRLVDDTAEGIRATLRRPIRIPSDFVNPSPANLERPPSHPPSELPDESAARQRAALTAEQHHLQRAYEAIMGLPPDQFVMKPMSRTADRKTDGNAASRTSDHEKSRAGCGGEGDATGAAATFLSVSDAAIERLGSDVRQTLEKKNIDIAGAPLSHVIAAIKSQWQDVSRQLAPYQAPAPIRVFRLGAHLFAVEDSAAATPETRGDVR